MEYQEYIKSELLVLVPVLYIIGLGETEEAKEEYKRTLDIAEKLYAPGTKQILDLRLKLS